MSKCRVCLVENVRMHPIINTRFQEMYEKLSGDKLNTEDGMPDTVCYICNSQLQKFGKFFEMSEKAERILTKQLKGGIGMWQDSRNWMKSLCNLTTTSINAISYIDNGEEVEPEVTVTIKEEPIDFEEEEFKEEYLDPTLDETNEVNATMDTIETTPFHTLPDLNSEESPNEKPTLWPIPDLQEEVIIKTEDTNNEENSDITESFLQNLSLALKQASDYSKFETGRFNYRCTLCRYKSNSARALSLHIRVHNPSYMYSCELCLYRFISEKKLADHRSYCTVCSVCGKRFSNLHGLKIHVRLHTGIQPFYCDSCGRGFNQKTNLKTHMRVHTREKQYPCKVCNKMFPFESFLDRHMLIHGNQPLDTETFRRTINCHKLYNHKKKNTACICNVCGRVLQSPSGLSMHMRLHTGEKPFSCESCNKLFSQKANLLTHVERLHAGDKLFSCRVCYKMFPMNRELVQHMPSHEVPMSAKEFEVFQQKHIYGIHRTIHNEEMTPYACDMCQTRIFSY